MTAVNLDFLTYTYNVNRIFKRHLIDFGMNSLNLCTKQQFQFKWFELTVEVKTDINIMLHITIFNCQGKRFRNEKICPKNTTEGVHLFQAHRKYVFVSSEKLKKNEIEVPIIHVSEGVNQHLWCQYQIIAFLNLC